MLRTIFAFTKFWFYIIGSIPKLNAAKRLERDGKTAERDALVNEGVRDWARYAVGLAGARVSVSGEENIPRETAVVFVGNHQGNFDIPILLGYVDKPKAFIAKIEILKIPVISAWMRMMQCTFLDRKNMRQSVRAMQEAVTTVQKGYSLVIFPEGTRSRGGPVAEFKPGSFKLALKAGVPIVPVSIEGSWHLLEEKGRFQSADVTVKVLPPIPTANLSREEAAALPEKVRAAIVGSMGR